MFFQSPGPPRRRPAVLLFEKPRNIAESIRKELNENGVKLFAG